MLHVSRADVPDMPDRIVAATGTIWEYLSSVATGGFGRHLSTRFGSAGVRQLNQLAMASAAGLACHSSKVSDMMSNTRRASWRTGDDGASSEAASNSETELTNGMGVLMTRSGNAFARAST